MADYSRLGEMLSDAIINAQIEKVFHTKEIIILTLDNGDTVNITANENELNVSVVNEFNVEYINL